MNKKVLSFVNKLEGYKTAIKQLHWDAKNMSQHELCDDIADSIAEFQDTVSEVEQSITGKLKVNSLKPTEYKIKDLKSFVQDVLDETNTFYKEIKGMGDTYVGMASDCESFLSDMQRKLYLVNFTLKEELKERLKERINESMPKNLSRHDEVDKFMGRKPKSIKARINQIYRIVKKYGIDSKVYHDENWQAISDYYRAISSLGCEVEMKPCGHLENADSIESDGGYCDYDQYDGMPRSKQYAIKIMFEDGMNIDGYIKCMAAGTVSNPFSSYDTCIVLWPKNSRTLKGEGVVEDGVNEYGDTQQTRSMMGAAAKRGIMNGNADVYHNAMNSLGKRMSSKDEYSDFQKGFEMESKKIKLSESELKQVIKEAATKLIKEWGFPDEGFGDDYNTPYGDFDDPRSDYPIGKEGDIDYSWDEDAYNNDETPLRMKNHHGDMDRLAAKRDNDSYWSDRELRHGNRVMDKYVHGKYDDEDVGDEWNDLHFEGKEPMKVTESELKDIVKEAAIKLIKEYGDTPKGQYNLGKLAARQRYRDNDTHKAARTEYYAGYHAPEDDRKYKQWARAGEVGYNDGKKEFSKETDESSNIEIKPSKKGTFTAAATKHGKSVQGFANQVLKNKENYSPAMVKKANFAKNFGGKK